MVYKTDEKCCGVYVHPVAKAAAAHLLMLLVL